MTLRIWCLVLCCGVAVDCVKYSSKYKSDDLNKVSVRGEAVVKNATEDDRIENYWPVKIFNCVGSGGVEKCLKIFLVKRLEHVLEVFNREKYGYGGNISMDFDVLSEIKKEFKWEQYKKMSDSDLNKMIFRSIESIFKDKKTKLVLDPGVDIEVEPNENGTMVLNIKKDPSFVIPRGMNNKNMFYRVIPVLLIPPLIMAGVMPFVLPALKMMIIWVGMINQMALMGAVFTLMRNNAFSETTEKRVIYPNTGYKNEKRVPPLHTSFNAVFEKNPHIQEAFNHRFPASFEHESYGGGLDGGEFHGGFEEDPFPSASNNQPMRYEEEEEYEPRPRPPSRSPPRSPPRTPARPQVRQKIIKKVTRYNTR